MFYGPFSSPSILTAYVCFMASSDGLQPLVRAGDAATRWSWCNSGGAHMRCRSKMLSEGFVVGDRVAACEGGHATVIYTAVGRKL
ncbi:hypothetical protein BHE74_00047052 [Ensete ventricosum]|nr:hypothetical protein BHE74_00047052 [Ensete ventricosum]